MIADKERGMILYDQDCALCNNFIKPIAKKALARGISFCPLNTGLAQQVLLQYGTVNDNKTVYYYAKGGLYSKSTAIMKIFHDLRGLWLLPWFFGLITPVFLRDKIYGLIARNRFKWFGKARSCYYVAGITKTGHQTDGKR